jgi:hypothetical protein
MKTGDRLSYRNDWEYDIYSVNKVYVDDIKEVMIKGKKYKVRPYVISIPYNDMGRTYTASSTHYFIKEKVFGVNMEFDLNEIIDKVPVYATKYKLSEDEREV